MPTKPLYLPYIDGLRAIAVIAVIAYHLNPALLPGGFTGVDIFFVISGYVVSTSVGHIQEMKPQQFITYFYARRLFRIAPALIICLLLTTLAFTLFVPASWLSGTNQKTGLAAFFGLSNFILAQTGNDYFSPRVDFNPFTHTWSLGVEEQFYLIFPWIFLPWLQLRRQLSAALVALAFIFSLLWSWHLASTDPNREFYMITSRFWELAAGVLLFQLQTITDQSIPNAAAQLGAWISAALLAAGLLFVSPSTTPFPGGILPVLGTLGIIGFLHGHTKHSALAALLEYPAMRFTGKISYSLYLWHWPVFVLFRWTCGLQFWLYDIPALAIVLTLAAASYYLVETPPRRALRALRLPRYVPVLIGAAALAAGYGVSSAIWALQPEISLSTVTKHADDWYPDRLPQDAIKTGCHIEASEFRISGAKAWRYQRTGCASPSAFNHQIFVIGDSHAAAYVTMLELFALQNNTSIFLYGSGGCSFIGLLNPTSPGCAAFEAAAAQDALNKVQPGDVIFLPALRIPRIVDQYTIYGEAAARKQMLSQQAITERQQGVVAALPILKAFSAKSANIIFEAPTPVFASVPFRCADWFNHTNPICAGGNTIPRATIDALRTPILKAYAQFQKQVSHIYVWDPTATLCPRNICSEYQNGRPLFFDGDHLSGYGNTILLPNFSRFLANLKP